MAARRTRVERSGSPRSAGRWRDGGRCRSVSGVDAVQGGEKGEAMRRSLVVLLVSLFAVLMPGSAGANTGGEPDVNNDYPFVGLLAFYDSDGQYVHRCTG